MTEPTEPTNPRALADRLARERTAFAGERTRLANERTFLAYTRTALGAFGAGAALVHFIADAPFVVAGWALIGLAPLVSVFGAVRFVRVRRRVG